MCLNVVGRLFFCNSGKLFLFYLHCFALIDSHLSFEVVGSVFPFVLLMVKYAFTNMIHG